MGTKTVAIKSQHTVLPLFESQHQALIIPVNTKMSNNNNLEAFLQNIIVASSDAELVSNTVLRQLKDLLRAVVIETFDQELKPLIEDLFRTVVQDVLESKLSVAQRNLEDHEIPITSNPRTLKLKFIEKAVSSPVYTGVEIKGEGGFPLRVALFDDITGNIVDSGPNASLEVEIVVLKVDYFRSPGGNDTWTAREFIDSIVRERETRNSLGRRSSSLLTERVLVKLDKGIGDVQNVKFRHTSSHMRNTQYRLGAHVTNLSRGTRIQEAMTDPFLVKDKHILRNVKYDTPSLSDDVWRLVNIGRRGPVYSHLKEQNVSTVEDLLILHLRDPILLKTTLCMKPSALEETLNNAKRCISNKVYCHTDSRRQHTGVVFNIFGQVLGLIRQSQYIPADDLSQDDKANAPQFLASAYEHWEEVECFDDPTSLVQKFPKLSSSTSCSNSCVEKMIGELLDPNTEFLIIDNGAGSSANDFGSTSCPWNIDEDDMLFWEREANEPSRAIDWISSNEPRDDGTLAKEKVWKKWKILVNIVKWLTQRRGTVAILEVVHVQKKPRHS